MKYSRKNRRGAGRMIGGALGSAAGGLMQNKNGQNNMQQQQQNPNAIVNPDAAKLNSLMQDPQMQRALMQMSTSNVPIAPLTSNGQTTHVPIANFLHALIRQAQAALQQLDALIPPQVQEVLAENFGEDFAGEDLGEALLEEVRVNGGFEGEARAFKSYHFNRQPKEILVLLLEVLNDSTNTNVMRSGRKMYFSSSKGQPSPVLAVQQSLAIWGYSLTQDGSYGEETEKIVLTFQENRQLEKKEGFVGFETLGELDELMARYEKFTQKNYAGGSKSGASNFENLMSLNTATYTTIEQRTDFYQWFYCFTYDLGYHTRWALAAWIVAKGAANVAHMSEDDKSSFNTMSFESISMLPKGQITNNLQTCLEVGNMMIFENVLPKLKSLLQKKPIVLEEALKWDMQVLIEEQTLIQPMYDAFETNELNAMKFIAQKGFAVSAMAGTKDDITEQNPYYVSGEVFGMKGDLKTPTHRWLYGMKLATAFCPRYMDHYKPNGKEPNIQTVASYQSLQNEYSSEHETFKKDSKLNFLPYPPTVKDKKYIDTTEFNNILDLYNSRNPQKKYPYEKAKSQ